jgi:diacylglycerol O-acyltransferase / wax synthase
MSEGAERMSRVDTAWLRMDNDVNLMMINGVWLLHPRVSLQAVRARISDKLLKYSRFGQKAVVDATGAHWVNDDAFDIQHHVLPLALPRTDGQSERAALQAVCGELAGTPLDASRPLWQFYLVEDYDGGSALVVRIHHCIGDGMALTAVMMSITDGGADPPHRGGAPSPAQDRVHGPESDHEDNGLADAVFRPLTELAAKAAGLYGDAVARSLEALSSPQQGGLGIGMDMARAGTQVLKDVSAFAAMEDDSPTRLKGQPAGRKVVAWGDPIPLDEVKAVGRALGCSVNDVLLACAAGAVGAYLAALGDDPQGLEIRAMVPVNLRPLDQAWRLGNRFGLAPLVLPIGIDNPVERVFAVHTRMAELKGSYQPLLAYAILALTGLVMKPVQDAVLGLFAKKTTAVMTNVPGPAVALKFCGATLRQSMFWVPCSGGVGVGLSILSYGGGVQFGLITDRALCPDPDAIAGHFKAEFDKLLTLTLMLPWGAQAAG